MQPHQQRVIEEKEELDIKIEKLTSFFETKLFHEIDILEQNRLKTQLHHMGEYSKILSDRINNFN